VDSGPRASIYCPNLLLYAKDSLLPCRLRGLAGVEGVEPPTPGFGDRCSSQLSYTPRRCPIALSCPGTQASGSSFWFKRLLNQAAPRPDISTMLTRRSILAAAACATLAGPVLANTVLADDGSAQAFIAAIYAAYKGKNSKGVRLDGDTALRRYFEPSLAAMILKDEQAAARRKDVPTLDGDPFVGGQDWEISAVNIAMTNVADTSATATATFNNAGTPTKVVYDLVRINNDWRIRDITWSYDGKPETLRSLYVKKN
jgi:Protein of unknown function (DUF3828)